MSTTVLWFVDRGVPDVARGAGGTNASLAERVSAEGHRRFGGDTGRAERIGVATAAAAEGVLR